MTFNANECNHKRSFDLNTSKFRCEYCGTDWDSMKAKSTLYCAIFMVKTPHGWAGDKIYMHCKSIEEARLQFFNSEQRIVRQVEIAPVIGYLAEDEHADVVSV